MIRVEPHKMSSLVLSVLGWLLERSGPHIHMGQRLEPQTRALTWLNSRSNLPKIYQQHHVRARLSFARQVALLDLPKAPMASVKNHEIPGPRGPIGLRILRSHGLDPKAPALIFYHGGGFVIGSLDTHEAACRLLAQQARCAVVMVDYRLAPEDPFPAGIEDAQAAYAYIARHADAFGLDARRLAIGGDSAGGNLTALVALHARDHLPKDLPQPVYQLLIYPAIDFTRKHASHRDFSQGYVLDEPTKDWFINHYFSGDEPVAMDSPRTSPIYADSLEGLPPAMVITAGFDPLRDEGQAYAAAMREAGVSVQERCWEETIHGVLNFAGAVSQGKALLMEAAEGLSRALKT